MSETSIPEDEPPVELLRRWESFGGSWRLAARTGDELILSLCRCDGGEEVQRLSSADPALASYIGDRSSSGE